MQISTRIQFDQLQKSRITFFMLLVVTMIIRDLDIVKKWKEFTYDEASVLDELII